MMIVDCFILKLSRDAEGFSVDLFLLHRLRIEKSNRKASLTYSLFTDVLERELSNSK